MAKTSSEKRDIRDRVASAIASIELPKAHSVIPAEHEPDLWQIVVIGTIDPRQHQPGWYRLIGCLSDEEQKVANQSLLVVGFPTQLGLASQAGTCQFDAGPFSVTVTPDRWVIQTLKENEREKITEVAIRVFTVLNEIYVGAFGVNRGFTIKTTSPAKDFLADKISGADLGLQKGNSECRIHYATQFDGFSRTVVLSPSALDTERLTVLYNTHHQIAPQPGYYDVGNIIKEYAEVDWQSAKGYFALLSECIARSKGD